MIGGVGEVLALQAYGRTAGKGSSMLPLDTAAAIVSLELDAWFGRVNFHRTTALRILKFGCKR